MAVNAQLAELNPQRLRRPICWTYPRRVSPADPQPWTFQARPDCAKNKQNYLRCGHEQDDVCMRGLSILSSSYWERDQRGRSSRRPLLPTIRRPDAARWRERRL